MENNNIILTQLKQQWVDEEITDEEYLHAVYKLEKEQQTI
jgi:hypothetical protein